MIKYFYYFLWMLCLIASRTEFLVAQDIHFSQFQHSPLNLNPALTAIFSGDYRIAGNYRSQWQSVPVDYMTFSGAYDMKIGLPNLKKAYLGGGIIFNADQAGDADFSLLQIALNASYTHQVASEHFLTLGLQLGMIQQRFEPHLLTYDEQWNGDVWDEFRPITEDFRATSISFGDISTGINWHYKSEKIVSNIGVGMLHLTQPTFSFFEEEEAVLKNKMSFYIIGTHLVSEKIAYSPRLLLTFQDAHTEGIIGVGLLYYSNRKKANELGIQPSINYRFNHEIAGDAIIPMLEIFYQSWVVGLSYDVNVSDFIAATNRQGGLELSVQYIIKKVAPPEVFKACPIF